MGRKVVSGHSGKTGRLFIDGTELCITSQEYTEISEEEDVTNSCSGGKNQYEYGNSHVEGSVEADWDIAANPHDSPPNVRSGSEHAVKMYIHSAAAAGVGESNPPVVTASGPFLEMDSCKFNHVKVTIPAKGKVHYSFTFKSNGNYSMPTGGDTTSGA